MTALSGAAKRAGEVVHRAVMRLSEVHRQMPGAVADNHPLIAGAVASSLQMLHRAGRAQHAPWERIQIHQAAKQCGLHTYNNQQVENFDRKVTPAHDLFHRTLIPSSAISAVN